MCHRKCNKMAYTVFVAFLLLAYNLLNPASAAAHGHSIDNVERESDGSYRARDADHYLDSGHNVEFDHEAILGSVKEAEEFDNLTPEESKKRLALLLPKMDINGDKFIDRKELKKWILDNFVKLSREEAEERMSEADDNRDGVVTWPEYLQDTFGFDSEDEVDVDDTNDSGMLVREEKEMWKAADSNNDGVLDAVEFEVFTNPEEHASMHGYLINQTLREKDRNKDGRIDFQEYVGERGASSDKEWLVSEKDKFDLDLDTNKDGVLDLHEIRVWVIPDNDEIAEEEVDHLFASADDDHDDLLSYEEVVAHHDVFVGSEAADYGGERGHFDDEL